MRVRLVAAVIAGFVMAAAVGAGQLTVPSDRDNTLYEEADGLLSNGAGDHFFAGVTVEGAIRRGLVHFDVSAIPPGSVVESAVLTLNMSRSISGPADVSLHALTADWGEGASDAEGMEGGGAASEPGDATWLHTFFATTLWSAAGGDFAPAASATTNVASEASYTWGSTAGMVADVQSWVDMPGQNYGWAVVGEEQDEGKGGGTAKRFDTREIGGEGPLSPMLVVQFLPPVPVELQTFVVDEE